MLLIYPRIDRKFREVKEALQDAPDVPLLQMPRLKEIDEKMLDEVLDKIATTKELIDAMKQQLTSSQRVLARRQHNADNVVQ